MGQGRVCVSIFDVLTPDQMTCWRWKPVSSVQRSGQVERLHKAQSGIDITSYSTGGAMMRTAHKQTISFCRAASKTPSFELISNYLASIVQITETKINWGYVMSSHSKPDLFWQHLCNVCLNWAFHALYYFSGHTARRRLKQTDSCFLLGGRWCVRWPGSESNTTTNHLRLWKWNFLHQITAVMSFNEKISL